jgi:hypothetical protein
MRTNRAVPHLAAAVCTLILLSCPGALARTIYVDDDAPTAGDGNSWASAYKHLQDALTDADRSEKPVEVRVAQGIYRPDQSAGYPDGTRDRAASFRLLDGVAILGGFAGRGARIPDARNIALYETILSGDLAGDDVPVSDPFDLFAEPTRAENSMAIVTAGPCSRSAVLDGFIVCSGNAIAPERHPVEQTGAGLLLSHYGADCCPSIRNCTFRGNLAHSGGAAYVIGAAPEIVNCRFLNNAAFQGGAILTSAWRGPWFGSLCEFLVRECLFVGNYARDKGGAVHTSAGAPSRIEGSSFTGNSARIGGAVYSGMRQDITNCVFAHNQAVEAGGGVYFRGARIGITSCTFFGNVAQAGTALACLEPLRKGSTPPSVTVVNTILWDGGNEIAVAAHIRMDVTYSNIQGGWPGEGNIDVDPLFAQPGYWADPDDPNRPGNPNNPNALWIDGDYHLKSQAGRWDTVNTRWVVDEVTSPCIDAGDPMSPIGLEPFPNGGRINMGAYGGTAEASLSLPLGPTEGLWSEPVPLTEINLDTAEEWSPTLSADGLTLYFGRVRAPDAFYGRLFQATRRLALPWSRFTDITELPGPLNQSVQHVLCPWISADGLRMYYTHQVHAVFRLMVSERPTDSAPWPMGRELRELSRVGSRLASCRLTVDELTIFFAGPDRQGGAGDYDIWIATRPDRDAPFDEPVNLAALNSHANDYHAVPSSDGLTIYFASNRTGRYRLFKSMRRPCDGSFSPPVPMGLFDMPDGHATFPCLSPDGTEFYFMWETDRGRSTRDIWVSYRLD